MSENEEEDNVYVNEDEQVEDQMESVDIKVDDKESPKTEEPEVENMEKPEENNEDLEKKTEENVKKKIEEKNEDEIVPDDENDTEGAYTDKFLAGIFALIKRNDSKCLRESPNIYDKYQWRKHEYNKNISIYKNFRGRLSFAILLLLFFIIYTVVLAFFIMSILFCIFTFNFASIIHVVYWTSMMIGVPIFFGILISVYTEEITIVFNKEFKHIAVQRNVLFCIKKVRVINVKGYKDLGDETFFNVRKVLILVAWIVLWVFSWGTHFYIPIILVVLMWDYCKHKSMRMFMIEGSGDKHTIFKYENNLCVDHGYFAKELTNRMEHFFEYKE